MKKMILGLTLLLSVSTLADTVVYSNSEGCVVEKEQRRNGVVLFVSKGDVREVVGYGNDYSFGDFAYCNSDATDINFFEGSLGTKIMISCSGHENGHKETRGRVDISIIGGELEEISIDGQVKGFFSWKQDTELTCSNLVKE